MHNLISLIKINLKNSNSITQNNPNKKINVKREKIIKYVLFALLFLLASIPFYFVGYSNGALVKDLEVNIFELIVPTSAFLIAFSSLPFVVSILFLQDDAKDLLYLPIKPRDIFISKIVSSIIQSYLFVFLFFLPFVIGILVGINASFDIYIYALIFTALAPILPIVIFALLFTLLSKIINFKAHKSLIQNIVLLFPLIILIAMEFGIPSNIEMIDPEQFQIAITNLINTLGGTLKSVFFVYIPSINSLSASTWYARLLYMLLSIVIIIGLAFFISMLVSKLYLKAIIKDDVIKKSNKKINDSDYADSNTFKSLLKSEIKSINRNSTYVFNLIIPTFVVPIIMLISLSISLFSNVNIVETIKEMHGAITLHNTFSVGLLLGITLFFSSTCFIASTAITRMGKNAYFIKMIPVKGSQIILSKIIYGVIISSIMSFVMLLILAVTGIMPIVDMILLTITSISINTFLNFIAISMDLKKPYLNWNTEIEACKNSSRSILFMLISWGLAILVMVVMVLLDIVATLLNFNFMGYIFIAFILLLSLLGNFLYYQHYDNMKNCDIFKNF